MNLRKIFLSSVAVFLLGCFVSFLAGREPSRSHQVANTHQPEFRYAPLSMKSVFIRDLPEKVDGRFFESDLAFLCRGQLCGRNEILHIFTRSDRRVSLEWRDIFEILGGSGKFRVNTLNHDMATFVCRCL